MLGWFMAFHVLGLILWAGGIFGAGRVLIDHARLGAQAPAVLGEIEKKLLFCAGHAGMLLVLVTGACMLALNPSYFLHEYWMYAKLAVSAFLVVSSIVLTAAHRKLEADPLSVDAKALNLWRGLFMACVFAALVLVFVKPF